jgi:acyl-CoA thioesterase-1
LAVQTGRKFIAVLLVFAAAVSGGLVAATAQERPVKIVALGDSLTAGFGLAVNQAFPAKLTAALKAKGINASIANAGVSGDTATGGLERLEWAIPKDTDAVIVELGANDMLRGIDPAVTRKAIDTIVRKLRERKIVVLVAGMLASPNMGVDYTDAFRKIFSSTAQTHDALYYPFFLHGVAGDPALNQPDGLHPTAAGVDVIVSNILPSVEQLIALVKSQRGS